MGRRELRAELESTWMVLEPRVPGVPFRKKDIADADERAALEVSSPPVVFAHDEASSPTHDDGPSTVTLAKREDLVHFKANEWRDIKDMDQAEARAVFGDGLYEAWRTTGNGRSGYAVVTSIGGKNVIRTTDPTRLAGMRLAK